MLPWYDIQEFLLCCGSKRTPWELGMAVTNEIHTLIPFDQARLYLLDGNGKIEQSFCLGVNPNIEREYYRYYASSEEAVFSTVSAAARFARHYPTVEQCVKNEQSYDAERHFYTEYVKPNHIEHSFGLGLRDNMHALRCLISLDRTCNVPYGQQDIAVMSAVRPHLDNLYQNLFVTISDGQTMRPNAAPFAGVLTKREREIAELLMQGITPQNIGRLLCISPTTVNKHIENIHAKLHVTTRQELLVKLLRG